jgi:hypothetical protein
VGAVVAVLAALAAPAGAQVPIRPGDLHETALGGCTLGFVYDGTGAQAGRVFMGTAAHCAERVGDEVRLESGEVFGDIALLGDQETTAGDFGLIEVRPAFASRVAPGMRGSESYPRGGYTTPVETDTADGVQVAGHGVGFGATPITREQRRGVLTVDDQSTYQVLATLIFGDSGGPVAHIPTGKALGSISRLCVGLCESEGPTVQGILASAAARGFTVRLRTV